MLHFERLTELEKEADALTRKWMRDGAKATAAKTLGTTSAENAATNARYAHRSPEWREAIGRPKLPVTSKMEIDDLARKGEGMKARMEANPGGTQGGRAHLEYGESRWDLAAGKKDWVSPQGRVGAKKWGSPLNNKDGNFIKKDQVAEAGDRSVQATQGLNEKAHRYTPPTDLKTLPKHTTEDDFIEHGPEGVAMLSKTRDARSKVLARRAWSPEISDMTAKFRRDQLAPPQPALKTKAQILGRPRVTDTPGIEFGVNSWHAP